jgi:quinone-modifying oxidoreductase subunit QmoA
VCRIAGRQARYLREKEENSKAVIFYIDIRAVGRFEKFYYNLLEDPGVSFIKGKVAEIHEDPESHDLILDVEDTLSSRVLHKGFDMVVLATGMVPNTADVPIPFDLKYDSYGFIDESASPDGVYAAGCVRHPCDVSRTAKDSTAAAMKAIQCLEKGE